jgi:hypothetical protein
LGPYAVSAALGLFSRRHRSSLGFDPYPQQPRAAAASNPRLPPPASILLGRRPSFVVEQCRASREEATLGTCGCPRAVCRRQKLAGDAPCAAGRSCCVECRRHLRRSRCSRLIVSRRSRSVQPRGQIGSIPVNRSVRRSFA